MRATCLRPSSELRPQRGSEVVVTDSNRRRRFVPNFGYQNLGRRSQRDDALDSTFAQIDPFPDRGPDAQTVSVLKGADRVRAPSQGGLLEFPERSAAKAFDGDRSTVWAADRYLRPSSRWIEIVFDGSRDVPWIELEPIRDPYGVEEEVEIEGVRARLGPGVTRVRLGLRNAKRVRVRITKVRQPPGELRGSGGFREIRIPGLRVSERLRTPLLAAKALAGQDLRRTPLSYILQRATADEPFRRDRYAASPLLELRRDRSDPERQLDRVLFAPGARRYAAQAWLHPSVDAPDSELDRMAGMRSAARFDSSGRYRNAPRFRASSAFDGRSGTAWMGIWAPVSAPRPSIFWRLPDRLTVSRLRLQPAGADVRRPTRVRLHAGPRSSPPCPWPPTDR